VGLDKNISFGEILVQFLVPRGKVLILGKKSRKKNAIPERQFSVRSALCSVRYSNFFPEGNIFHTHTPSS